MVEEGGGVLAYSPFPFVVTVLQGVVCVVYTETRLSGSMRSFEICVVTLALFEEGGGCFSLDHLKQR